MKFLLDTIYRKIYNAVDMKTKIIKRLEEYRLKNRISQQKLADMLGVTFVTVNRWMNGHTKPNRIDEYHIRKLLEGAKK